MKGRIARTVGRRLQGGVQRAFPLAVVMSVGALFGCLDDTPTKAAAPTVRAMLSANVVSREAGGTVTIRVGYRNSQQQFVALPSSPERVTIASGATVVLPVTVDIGPCLADATRQGGAEAGCILTVELTLSDAGGEVIDRQTRDARAPASPGQSVDFGSVTIGVTVSAITVAPASLGMRVADEQQLTATVRDGSGAVTTTQTVTWSTSDATVAQLLATTGAAVTVRALKVGTASVTASAGGKTSAPVSVGVTPATLTLTQRQGQGCVIVGQSINLDVTSPPGAITWSSGSPDVATVSSTGVVTGVLAGQAVITATSGGRTGTATVCVIGPLRVSSSNLSVVAGQTVQIATSGATGGTLSFASGAPAIATVDGNGVVRGVGLGQTTVTVTLSAASGTQSIPVQVTVTAAGLAVSPTSASTAVNGTVRFTANPLDATGAALPAVPVTWSISDASIGSLSTGSGTAVDVRGLKLGTATVRATLGTLSANAQLTVTAPLPAARLEKVSGDGTTCPTRSTTCTFVVRVVDVNGVPVAGAIVTWSSNAACGPPQNFRTDASGLSTANNICASVAPGAYTQTAALASIGVQVSFAFTLRGLVLTFQTVDNTGSYVYAVTSPSGAAAGLSAKVDFTSGPISDYVTKLGFSSTSTPSTLTVGIQQTQFPPGDYAFDVIVSTTTSGIGPGVATVTFSVSDSLGSGGYRRSGRDRPTPQPPTRAWKAP